MQRPAALLLVLLSVTLPLSAAGVFAGPPSNVEQTSSGRDAVQQTSFDRNRVVLTVHENGSTKWTFHYRRTLNNASEREEFRAFSDEFNSNETNLYRGFKSNAETLTSEGQNATGREMNATSFSRRAYVSNTTFGQPVGVVEMSFVWTRFAVVRGERVIVGDVFEGGLYLRPGLTLVVSPEPGLVFDSVDPPGTPSNASSLRGSDSVTWQGEKEFTDNRPRIVLVPSEGASQTSTPQGTAGNGSGTDDAGTGSGGTDDNTTPPASSGGGLPVVPLGVGALLIAGVAAVWWYSDRDDDAGPVGVDDDPNPGSGAGPTSAATDSASEADGETPIVTDDELLSDEDRVVSMLRDQGGRMKQVNIVDRTGWSKSKVSMLLSEMEEDGRISKLRVGRENVISLKGHEPDAASSPFDGDE